MIRWQQLSESQRNDALARPAMDDGEDVRIAVTDILESVRAEGDIALRSYAQKFDGVSLDAIALTEEERANLLESLAPDVKAAIDLAFDNIKRFHQAQKSADIRVITTPGVNCELRIRPIKQVGLYIPGGSAPLPSTVLMAGIPAMIAGCENIVLATPVRTAGQVDPSIVYAAQKCGVSQIYQVGGAQAIGALAYGTDSIPAVDKIFGPGNRFVTEAKQQVSQQASGAAIDMPAGPSEVLVLADGNANPDFVAADLLSQLEHGPDSQAIVVSCCESLIEQTRAAVNRQVTTLSRQQILNESINNIRYIYADDIDTAVAITNRYAPEHLIIQADTASQLVNQIDNASSIFVGPWSPESVGDYASGTNHILPTYGYSKVLSSLSLADFTKLFTVQTLSEEGLNTIADAVMTLADAEGLDAHKNAVAIRVDTLKAQRLNEQAVGNENTDQDDESVDNESSES